jgi:predicted flap endonuclease-1-like 5' DNA nuclease
MNSTLAIVSPFWHFLWPLIFAGLLGAFLGYWLRGLLCPCEDDDAHAVNVHKHVDEAAPDKHKLDHADAHSKTVAKPNMLADTSTKSPVEEEAFVPTADDPYGFGYAVKRGSMRWDQNLGYLYHQKPKAEDVDDLSKAGIDADSVNKLNDAGVWNFKQLFSLSDEMRQKLQSFFNIPMINWGWIGNRFGFKSGPMAAAGAAGAAMVAALGTDAAKKAEATTARATSLTDSTTTAAAAVASAALDKVSIPGADTFADDEKAGKVSYDADWGWRWKSRPPESEIDDLTLVNGIGPAIQKWLNENGIWSFKQLAHWPKALLENFDAKLSMGGRAVNQVWSEQAERLWGLKKEGKPLTELTRRDGEFKEAETNAGSTIPDVEADWSLFDADVKAKLAQVNPSYGIVYKKHPDKVDDLLLVNGVGKALRDRLHDLGIYHFSQLSCWTPKIIAAVEKKLGLNPGHLSKERWSAQAKRLHELKQKGQPLKELSMEEVAKL